MLLKIPSIFWLICASFFFQINPGCLTGQAMTISITGRQCMLMVMTSPFYGGHYTKVHSGPISVLSQGTSTTTCTQ